MGVWREEVRQRELLEDVSEGLESVLKEQGCLVGSLSVVTGENVKQIRTNVGGWIYVVWGLKEVFSKCPPSESTVYFP